MICQECKAEIHGAPKFCPKCGAKVEAVRPSPPGTKLCPQCGAENSLSAKFCKSDAYRFPDAAEAVSRGEAIQQVAPPPPIPAAPPPTAPEPSTAPAQKVSPAGTVAPTAATAQFPPVAATSRADEGVESVCEERPIPTTRGPQAASSGPRHKAEEAPQPVVAARAEPRRIAATVPEPRPNLEPKPEKSRKPLLVAVAALLAVALSAAGGAYWFGYVGNRQASVQEKINAELCGKGLSNVKVTVAKDWKTTVEGVVGSSPEKQQALALISGHSGLKEITDNIRVKPTREELAQRLTKALADAGMSQVAAQVDEGLTAVALNDPTLGPGDRAKAEALEPLAKFLAKVIWSSRLTACP